MILFGDGIAFLVVFLVVFLSACSIIFGIMFTLMDREHRERLFWTGVILIAIGIPFFIIAILDQSEAHGKAIKQSIPEIKQLDNMTCTQIKQWRLEVAQNKTNPSYYAIVHADELAGVCK